MAEMHIVEVLAGYRPDGQPVIERLEAYDTENPSQFRLIKSPAFAPSIAKDDLIKLADEAGQYSVIEHGGNLAIRIICKVDEQNWGETLKGELEKIGASIDRETPRMIVASVHVTVGFTLIEQTLDKYATSNSNIIWQYGNVYDPETGNPLNWWQDVQSET